MPVPTFADSPSRPACEVADVFRLFGPLYRATHRLPLQHLKVMRSIEQCRTAALGGHIDECDACGHQRISYNSCRNRHCPKCQNKERERWVQTQKESLLPISYFHVVFTLPDEINRLAQWNQRLIYDLLFRAVSETLLEFGERHLGGELGLTTVLHTWGQQLHPHIHLHCIVTGGALARDGSRWKSCRAGFLFPTRALSMVYRGKYMDHIQRAFARGELQFGGEIADLAEAANFARFLRKLSRHKWVVYAKRPFAGPEQVIGYVGRYTHRVAITNRRIRAIDEQGVTFEYKDYRDGEKTKQVRLTGTEFIRRFLWHVLPEGFVRIRHYGLLANGRRRAKIACCRELLAGTEQRGVEVVDQRSDSAQERGAPDEQQCPACARGRMVRVAEISGGHGPPVWQDLADRVAA